MTKSKLIEILKSRAQRAQRKTNDQLIPTSRSQDPYFEMNRMMKDILAKADIISQAMAQILEGIRSENELAGADDLAKAYRDLEDLEMQLNDFA